MKTEASTTIPEDPETAEKRAQFLSNMIKRALVAEEIERFR
jgi:hypothetical protein